MLEIAVKLERGAFELNANLQLRTPGVVAVFGRSGCGKSTLINVVAGLLQAQGRIVLDQAVLLDTERGVAVLPELRQIGYVFQDSKLFPHLRVGANLRYAERRARVKPYVSFDGVVSLLNLEGLVARRTHQLSGGEKQRVAIGRALLSQPRLLLLDEPLASLDAERREEVLPYLESLRDQLQIPMVYVSHNFEEVRRLATCIVLMKDGTTISQGEIGAMSMNRDLRAIIGTDAVGAVIDGTVLGVDPASGLTRVGLGTEEIKVRAANPRIGSTLRVQFLARDLIVATHRPQHVSVRNMLQGKVTFVSADEDESDLIGIDIGGPQIVARITQSATRDLALQVGMPVWALVKSVSLRTHPLAA